MSKHPVVRARRTLPGTGIFHIEELDLAFSNGQTRCYQRIVGSDEGAVLVVPMPDPETVLLIREYAAGMERYDLAFPKGRIETGEDVLVAANREIQEETGYGSRRLEKISSVTLAPGYLFHTTHIVLARDLYPQRLPGDEPEPIEVVPWKLGELDNLVGRQDFNEARSIAALFMVREWLGRERWNP